MAKDSIWTPKMKTYFNNSSQRKPAGKDKHVRVYLDNEQKQHTVLCHKKTVALMLDQLRGMPDLKHARALDAGCGDGRITKSALVQVFEEVDLFD